jgi:hypothetical protein
MNTQAQNKREILKDQVVTLVKEFTKTEGELTLADLHKIFGDSPFSEVNLALLSLPIKFS